MHIIEQPCVPFATPVLGGMNHDAKIEIHGEPVHGCHSGFTIDLPSVNGIALHMDVRMGKHGEHCIVLNSLRHGHWGCEERQHQRFHTGSHFHLKIKNHRHHYAIHLNGCHLATFHHREDPHCIRELAIKGDLRVQKIYFEHFHHNNGGGIQVGSIAPAPVIGFGVPVAMAPPIMPAPVVVVEEPHHHHHHHHGLLHHLFHHHHCE